MTGQPIALAIAYQGTAYRGWQRQSRVSSVQACVEQALSRVADSSVTVVCAGRTDAGVHASHQVVSFVAPHERSMKAWVRGTNQYLPQDIRVSQAVEVGDDFPLIGVGGVASGLDAAERVRAGADIVQVYSGMIYRGPQLITEAAKAIARL